MFYACVFGKDFLLVLGEEGLVGGIIEGVKQGERSCCVAEVEVDWWRGDVVRKERRVAARFDSAGLRGRGEGCLGGLELTGFHYGLVAG